VNSTIASRVILSTYAFGVSEMLIVSTLNITLLMNSGTRVMLLVKTNAAAGVVSVLVT
jgi:hypothetical protein